MAMVARQAVAAVDPKAHQAQAVSGGKVVGRTADEKH